ncbi:MAG: 3-keto-disaccharide hydrolase [Pirellulaceae bacterium]
MRTSLWTPCVWSALLLVGTPANAQDPKTESVSGVSAAEAAEGFVPIFDGKSLDGWVGLNDDTSSYYVRDGILICTKTGNVHIFTKKEYANFILRLQIKLDPGGNNGIGIRTEVSDSPHIKGMEIQVLEDSYYDDGDPIKLKDYQHHGSIYGLVPAKTGHLKPPGEWNDEEILCDGRHIKVTLNGTVIVDADLDKVKPLDGAEHPGMKYTKGHLGLHAHGNYDAEVFFRNLRVKELD